MFEYAVIGKGLFGAAAARHLSSVSGNIAVIGPDEPAELSTHTGVFASHYDQGRLQRHMSRNLVWAILSHRAYREYADIEARSGIQFYFPVDSVHLAPRSKDSVFVEAAAETARQLHISCTMVQDSRAVTERFPMLSFPHDSHGYIEHAPAGYTNPRDMIRAQLAISTGRGATVVRKEVMRVDDRGDHVAITTADGHSVQARRALITAGAYCNSFDLLRRKLAMRVKSEIIILARVSERERERLTGMPSMIYELEQPPLETIYMLPPIRYPDGHTYLKMGCNTEFDRYLSSPEEKGAWVRNGDSDLPRAAMEGVMRSILPGLALEAVETKRCLITYTTEMWPYIDQVEGDRVFLATGGNGMGAKASAAIGQIAAEMMIHGRWVDELDHCHFRARYEDELEGTGFSWGARGMAKRLPPPIPAGASTNQSQGASTKGPKSSPKVRRAAAHLGASSGVSIADVFPWPGVARPPFGASWIEVAAGARSERHMHHEGEIWIVAQGQGVVATRGASERIGPGDSVYLPPFSEHTIEHAIEHPIEHPIEQQPSSPAPSAKPSSGGGSVETPPLRLLAMWWEDLEAASAAARHALPSRAAATLPRLVVTITPPTPNGELHLGHLAGPYLGGDIYARGQRMQGRQVLYVTGSDDHQSYVAGKALRTNQRPEEVADHHVALIEQGLQRAGVRCDRFTRSQHPGYVEQIQRLVEKLHQQGHVVAAESDYLVAPGDPRPLFEFYISGRCPRCAAPAGGGCCEECGWLNEGIALVDPVATLGGVPQQRRRITRLVLPLARHERRVRELVAEIPMSTHLRSLAEALLEEPLPDVPVTHPAEWGLPCTIEGFRDQVISTWFEMGHNMLSGARPVPAAAGHPPDELVQFFGFDNGFYYALLYPLLYELVEPGVAPPAALMCNEFYLLEGEKFSTSRNHAVWVRALLEHEPVDAVRFYLAHTRPEVARTSFSMLAYRSFLTDELRGRWQGWLRDLGRRVSQQAGGLAPEAGLWTQTHRRFFCDLDALRQRTQESYQTIAFSTQAITHQLVELVRRARELATAEAPAAAVPTLRDQARTALALELVAARMLAQLSAPIMPAFAQQLWAGLGLLGHVDAAGFDASLSFVPAGNRLILDGELFPPPTP
jgi:methionyl-tRNA synthetase